MSLFLVTFTLRFRPDSEEDLSIDGLNRRRRVVLDGVRYCWRRYLKRRGRAMAFAVEVAPGGEVHVHALYHGDSPDVNVLRMLYMERVGNSPWLDVRYVRKPRESIRELAKYMVKAASPKRGDILRGGRGEFTDPELAARVEVAFSGERLLECLGKWRGADAETDEPEPEPRPCQRCGCLDRRLDHLPLADWLAIAGPDWQPLFRRAGPDPPRAVPPPSQGEGP